MELTLQQQQKLQLVMTQELRQSIEILQYSTYDLYQYIHEQALENPLIEIEEDSITFGPSMRKNSYQKMNTDRSQVNPFDYIADEDPTVYQQLIEQARWLILSDSEYNIVCTLIGHLDDSGYLSVSTSELAVQMNLDESEIKRGLDILQNMEPVGIGARNLQECLLLQVDHYYPEETTIKHIIRDHLHLLANRKWQELARKMNVSLSEVKSAYKCIQTLHPKPGNLLSTRHSEYVYPDVLVSLSNDQFTITLNDHYLPGIRLNDDYIRLMNDQNDVSDYIHNRYNHYRWLINSIEKRRSTILKITKAIIRKQKDFFIHGLSSLKPLTLKNIADEIDMHESTVSRATMNKVIQTPKGSFDFRTLFATKLSASRGKSLSQMKVKLWLQELVQKENKYKPLSDQKMADYLRENKGVRISRRTVAKYRQELNIPPSQKRKEIKT